MSTSGPKLWSVSFTTNCCDRQFSHQTVLPVSPPKVKRSPLRTSVSAIRSTGALAVVAVAVEVVALGGVALAPVGTLDGDTDAEASGFGDGRVVGPPHATTNAIARQKAARIMLMLRRQGPVGCLP
jgi:hypothetical protein